MYLKYGPECSCRFWTMAPKPETNRDNPNPDDRNEREISAMDSPQFIIEAGSSEDEEDDGDIITNDGYQMLPQEPGHDMFSDDEDDGDELHDAQLTAQIEQNTLHDPEMRLPATIQVQWPNLFKLKTCLISISPAVTFNKKINDRNNTVCHAKAYTECTMSAL